MVSINRLVIGFLVCFSILMHAGQCGSANPIWSGSSDFKAGTFIGYSATKVIISSSSTKSGGAGVTFASAFSNTPSFLMGINVINMNSCPIFEASISYSSLSSSGFQIDFAIGSSTVINSLTVHYIGINSAITAVGTYCGVDFASKNSNSMGAVGSGTGDRTTTVSVNFTAGTGQVFDMTHVNIFALFTTKIKMSNNNGKFNLTVIGALINSNNYTVTVRTSGNTTISLYWFARAIYDQTVLQSAQQTFIDGGSKIGTISNWSALSLGLPYVNVTNIMVGMLSIGYEGASTVVFNYNTATQSASGTMSFNMLEFSYLNYRYRTCPGGFPYYCPTTSLCYDVCPYYNYLNTTSSLCLSCGSIVCYTCSNSTTTTCLSCDPTTDHRVLNGTTCSCMSGYYSVSGTSVCAACMPSCGTCTIATACVTCPASSFRTLTSGQCPCNTGYVDVGVAVCALCSTYISGCTACTSTTVCTSCNSTGKFQLTSNNCTCMTGYYYNATYYTANLACAPCSVIPGCTVCTSSTVCTTCNSTSGFSLSGSTCVCPTGKYLSGSTCVACPTGCTTCTGPTSCTVCATANQFTLSGGVCVCQSGYTLNPATSYTTCVGCSASMANCLTCSSTSSCTTCNSSRFLTAVSGNCVCMSGYFNNSGVCTTCSSVLSTACLACTSSTVCTSCQSPLTLSGGVCVCSPGYYNTGGVCVACSSAMMGCSSCTSSTNCNGCNAAGGYTLSGSACVCATGYYLSGTNCLTCTTGCQACSGATVCNTCNAALHYVSDGSNGCICDSASGYVLSGSSCVTCGTVNPGCTSCTSPSVCTACDGTVVGLTLSGGACSCPATYAFNSTSNQCEPCAVCCLFNQYWTGSICQYCSSLYSNCVTCTSSVCSTCDSGYTVVAGACQTCSTTLPGCTSCSSTSVCSACDTAQQFTLTGSSCTCVNGYALNGAICQTCSTTLNGCLECTSISACTSCDLTLMFITNPANSSQCICKPGFYLVGSSCVACSMTGCLECSGVSTCTLCDATQQFVLSGASCVCTTGYYLNSGVCSSCSILTGCTQCLDSSTCTQCNSTNLFELLPGATTCTCIQGYYLSGGVCTQCPTGCTGCDATQCTSCQTANHYELVAGACVCQDGFIQSGLLCVPCDTLYNFCLNCSITGCNLCSSPMVLNSSQLCECPYGYYNASLYCELCSSQYIGCLDCNLGLCTVCDSSSNFQLSAPGCGCSSGYILQSTSCISCSSLMNGCDTCTSTVVCDTCLTAQHYVMANGACVCDVGYYLDADTQTCIACISKLDGCLQCANNSTCTVCDTSIYYYLLSNNTCGCLDGYVRNGPICQSCMISCVCVGFTWQAGVCLPFCSDRVTIYPHEQCDDGNTIDGDGCSATCQEENNYTCIIESGNVSRCSWNQPFQMNLNGLIKDPATNTLTFVLDIFPLDIPSLANFDFSTIITTDLPLTNMSYQIVNGQLLLSYNFDQSLHGQTGNIQFTPGVNANFFATPSINLTFTVDPTNNLPAVVYDNSTYDEFKTVDKSYKGVVYTSYALLAFGMVCDKVVGVELFGVLQLAHLATSDLNSVQPWLSPLMNLSIVHGVMIKLFGERNNLPKRVREIGYEQQFLNNMAIMLGLALLDILVGLVLYGVGSLIPTWKGRLQEIGLRMLKEYLLMIVTFNALNTAYSFGLQITYGDPNDQLYIGSMCAMAISMSLPVIMGVMLIKTDKKEFGEFSSHYKPNIMSQGYFIFTLLYRLVLGQSMSRLNEVEEATILNVFMAIIFMLYLMTNLPYKQAYQNYRAIIVQATMLVILSVTMFYRSMKGNTSPAITYKIIVPGLIQLGSIAFTMVVSAVCLGYQFYCKWFKKPEQRPPSALTQKDEPRNGVQETQLNLDQSVSEVPMEDFVPEILI